MRKILVMFMLMSFFIVLNAKEFQVYGPQGGLDMKVRLPEDFDVATDSCPMVILMHGIFAGKNITPMPSIAKQLAKDGIASIRFTFGGHWNSEGKMVNMTIEKELQDAMAIWEYVTSLPYVTKIGILGHSQGGVVASMTAGCIATSHPSNAPDALVLLAPASILKEACLKGKMLGASFDPIHPPTFIKCFGIMKLGREYILDVQQLDIFTTAAAYKGPVKIIHGSEDKIVPLRCSYDYQSTYSETSDVIVVEHENHRLSRRTNYIARLVSDFFQNRLR